MKLSGERYYEWGSNLNAQLDPASNTTVSVPLPRISPQLDYIRQRIEFWFSNTRNVAINFLAGGQEHSVAVVRTVTKNPPNVIEDFVITYGNNDFGQLGVADLAPRTERAAVALPNSRVRVSVLFEIKQACAGANYSAILSTDGAVWTWGSNDKGQLGIGSYNNTETPRLVMLAESIRLISCGSDFMFAVTERSPVVVYSWGNNDRGQLADPTEMSPNRNAPMIAFGIPPDSVNVQLQTQYICAGGAHGLYISQDTSSVYAWGSNQYGQLGQNKTVAELAYSSVPQIVANTTATRGVWCGVEHVLLYKPGQTQAVFEIQTWGRNSSGQVGIAVNGIDYTDTSGSVRFPVTVRELSTEIGNSILLSGLGEFHTIVLQTGPPTPPVTPPAQPTALIPLYVIVAITGFGIVAVAFHSLCCRTPVPAKRSKITPPPSPPTAPRARNYNSKTATTRMRKM